jgi:repressor LexA
MIDFLAENTYQPSIREIARKFRIKSTKTVSDLLHALERKGLIERDESRSRGVRLLGYASSGGFQPVPVYGRVQSGEPALVADHRSGYVTIDRRFLPSEDVFVLKAQGTSLSARGILDGDHVMITPSAAVKDADVVAVRLGDDATFRIATRRGSTVVLEATESDRSIEIESPSDARILGVVCGVFRPYWDQPPATVIVNEDLSTPFS